MKSGVSLSIASVEEKMHPGHGSSSASRPVGSAVAFESEVTVAVRFAWLWSGTIETKAAEEKTQPGQDSVSASGDGWTRTLSALEVVMGIADECEVKPSALSSAEDVERKMQPGHDFSSPLTPVGTTAGTESNASTIFVWTGPEMGETEASTAPPKIHPWHCDKSDFRRASCGRQHHSPV